MADRDAIKSDSFCFHVAIDRKGNTNTTTVRSDNLNVPIGALSRIIVVVTVDEQPVEVINSQWTLQGEQITAVTQTEVQGVATVIPGPREMVGTPDYIETAWIATGPQGITTEGTFQYEGWVYPFTASGTATIIAPNITTSQAHVNDGGRWDNDIVSVQFVSGAITMDVPPLLADGTGGFLQIVAGERYRGENDGQSTQTMGSQTAFLDTSGEGLFYAEQSLIAGSNELSTNDQPSQKTEQHDDKFPNQTFNWYGIGTKKWDGDDPPAANESFDTYIAFKAPKTKGVIESYIVTRYKVNWWWSAILKYMGGPEGWDLDKYQCEDEPEWKDLGGWSITEMQWTNNSIQLQQWSNVE